jgi:hypothetical protein
LVGDEFDDEEDLDKKLPAKNCKPVQESVPGKFATMARSLAVATGRSQQLGSDSEIDDRILLLSNNDAVAVKEASERIDGANYLIREEDNLIVTYRKQGNNVSYAVDCNSGTCMCHSYMKWGYCKHLLHAHVPC